MLRIALFVLIALILVPIAGIVYLQFYGAIMVAGVASALLHGGDPPVEVPKGWNVVNLHHADSEKKDAFRTIVEPDALTPGRRVTAQAIMNIGELRGSDPRPVGPEEYDRYASLRAPDAARDECAVIREIFAAKCIVEKASAYPLGNGVYSVEMHLGFTNKDSFGPVSSDSELSFLVTSTPLGSSRPTPIFFVQQKSARLELYRAAAAASRKLRASNGNCGIVDVRVSTSRSNGTLVSVNGAATLATLRTSSGPAAAQR